MAGDSAGDKDKEMQVSEVCDLEKANDSQVDEDKEKQVSEAGDSKKG